MIALWRYLRATSDSELCYGCCQPILFCRCKDKKT